jgi:hypothetical protein
VIFEKEVAEAYLKIMNNFGVGINLKKSVVATNASFEFAKVSYSQGHFVSPISWKMFMSQNNSMGRTNILYYLLNIRELKSPVAFIKNIIRTGISKIGDYNYHLIALLSMYSNSGKLSRADLLKSLLDSTNEHNGTLKAIKDNLNIGYIETLLTSLYQGKTIQYRNSLPIMRIYKDHLPWHRTRLSNRFMDARRSMGPFDKLIFDMTCLLVDTLAPGIPEDLRGLEADPDREYSLLEMDQLETFKVFYNISENLLGNSD